MYHTEGKSIKEKLFELDNIGSERVSIYEIAEILGRNASHLLVIILVSPLLLPVTAIPGMSQVLSLAILFLLSQLLFERRVLWLPEKIARKKIDNKDLKKITHVLVKFHKKIERFVKPRMQFLTSIFALKIHYLFLIFTVLVLALPFPAPFANTIPAIGIILITFGIIEKEGISIIVGYIFGILAALYMLFVFMLGKEFYQMLIG